MRKLIILDPVTEDSARKYCEATYGDVLATDMTEEEMNMHLYEWVVTDEGDIEYGQAKITSYFIDGFLVADYGQDEESCVEIKIYTPYTCGIKQNFFVRNEVKARTYIETHVRPWE